MADQRAGVCLARLTAALDRDTLEGYEEFLDAYASDPLAGRVRAIVAARREAITWRRSYRTDTAPAYWSYLRRYPRGPHAWDARRRLAALAALLEPPRSFAMMSYDVPPPPPDEITYLERPVMAFDDPSYGFAPPPPPPTTANMKDARTGRLAFLTPIFSTASLISAGL